MQLARAGDLRAVVVDAGEGSENGKLQDKSARLISIDFFGKARIEAGWHDGAPERGVVRRRIEHSPRLMDGGYRDLVTGWGQDIAVWVILAPRFRAVDAVSRCGLVFRRISWIPRPRSPAPGDLVPRSRLSLALPRVSSRSPLAPSISPRHRPLHSLGTGTGDHYRRNAHRGVESGRGRNSTPSTRQRLLGREARP